MTSETTVSILPIRTDAATILAALNADAWFHQYGDPFRSRDLATRALALANEQGDEAEAAYAQVSLSCFEMRHGDREVARKGFEQARSVFERLDDLRGQVRASYGLAGVHSRESRCDSAYAELIGYLSQIDQVEPIDAFTFYNSLGANSVESDQVDEGLRYLYKALTAARDLKSTVHLTLVLTNLGSTQHDAGNYEDAIRFLVEAYDMLSHSDQPTLGPLVAGNLAMCQLAVGAAEAAYETIQPYLKVDGRLEQNALDDRAFLQSIAAHTFVVREEWAAAEQILREAMAAAIQTGEVRIQTHCHWVEALIARGQGRLEASLTALRQAEALLCKLQDSYYAIQVYREMAQAYADLGHWQLAYGYLEQHHRLYERSQGSASRARNQIMQIQAELGDAERERDFALLKHAQAERARSEQEVLNQELAQKVEEIERLQTKLKQQALRDPLTDLYNRRYLQDELPRQLALAERVKMPISVVLIDLDHFKLINDQYGHLVGDKVLIEFAELMRNNIRDADFACRYGGEEFCVVLADIGLDRAIARIQELLQRFHVLTLRLSGRQQLKGLTFSAGVAEFSSHGRDAEALLKAADAALYRAKAAGRNRILAAR